MLKKIILKIAQSNSYLIKSVSSSILSKISTVIVQIFAVRMIIEAVGVDGLGIFSIFMAVISTLVSIGACNSNSIARDIAKNSSNKNISLVLLSSIVLTLIICIFISAIFIIFQNYIIDLFGLELQKLNNIDIYIVIIITILISISSISDFIRLGLLQNHINNIIGIITNISIVAALYILNNFDHDHIYIILIAFYAPQILIKFYSILKLCIRYGIKGVKKIEVLHKIRKIFKNTYRFLYSIISGILIVNGVVLIIGIYGDLNTVAIYSLLIRYFTLIGGVLFMFTTPLWPELLKMAENGESKRVKARISKYTYLFLTYISLVVIINIMWIDKILNFWIGIEINFDFRLKILIGLYLFLYLISHVYYIFLISFGQIYKVTIPAFLESISAIILVILLVGHFGLNGIFFALIFSNLVFTSIRYKYYLNNIFKEIY
jgi:O-antigen/teichoic acid export membrane protein